MFRLLLLIAACNGDKDTDTSDPTGTATGTTTTTGTATGTTGGTGTSGGSGTSGGTSGTTASDWCTVQHVFEHHCTSCHSVAGGLSGALDLQDDAWAQLVGVDSSYFGGWVRVVPGEPEASLLYTKIANTQGDAGGAMPYGTEGLASVSDTGATEADAIWSWIAAGAPDDDCSGTTTGSTTGGSTTGGSTTGGSTTGGTTTGGTTTGGTSGATTGGTTGTTGLGAPWTLTVEGSAYSGIHKGQDVYLNVVRERDSAIVGADIHANIGDAFKMVFPNILEAGESYRIDWFADHNYNGTCEPYPDDHVWSRSIGKPAGDQSERADHSGATLNDAGCDSF